ncbi:MAG: LPP20 family lipoprotein, partial [Bacteroidales bacterium]|nr:LPP20 family lipoprotein [Bacteroidales bacterium]
MEVKKCTLFLCILLCLPFVLQAQRQREKKLIEEQVTAIRNNPEYLSAVGVGESMEEADRQALAALSSQITVCVSSQLDVQTSVEQSTDNFSKTDRVNSQIQTYSMTNLSNET